MNNHMDISIAELEDIMKDYEIYAQMGIPRAMEYYEKNVREIIQNATLLNAMDYHRRARASTPSRP